MLVWRQLAFWTGNERMHNRNGEERTYSINILEVRATGVGDITY